MIDPPSSEMSARSADLLSFSIGMKQNQRHADPPGTSRALPGRPTGDQPDRAFHTRRHRWRLAGYRDPRLPRRPWPSASPPARRRAARSDRDDQTDGLYLDRASQPRSDVQWPAWAQPRSALPARPHDPRRGRASPEPLVERLSPARYRRPFLRSVQLDGQPCAKARTQAAKDASEGRTPAALRFNVTGGTHDRNPPNTGR